VVFVSIVVHQVSGGKRGIVEDDGRPGGGAHLYPVSTIDDPRHPLVIRALGHCFNQLRKGRLTLADHDNIYVLAIEVLRAEAGVMAADDGANGRI
jgi:hypothetical protein